MTAEYENIRISVKNYPTIKTQKEQETNENRLWTAESLCHLPGELLKDVTALSVQDGDGLGKVMSL